jgi:hypothetical protein
MRTRSIAMGIAAAALLPGLGTAQTTLALRVADHAGVARQNAPVRGGIPFPRGALRDCATARLRTEAGADLPCRVRPLAHWYDGSIKWLLVDTQVDLPARGAVRLQLEPGAAAAASAVRVTVHEDAEKITVDSGPARFAFAKTAFGLPSAAWADLDGDGQPEAQVVTGPGEFVAEIEHQPPGPPQEENWLRDAAGSPRERFTAGPPGDCRAVVEGANDLRAVIKLSGWLCNPAGRRLLQYVIRAHVSAGSRDLRLVPTVVYAGTPKEDFVRALFLRFPRTATGPASWGFGGEQAHTGSLAAGTSVSLFETGPDKLYHLAPYTQDKAVAYAVVQGDTELARGTAATGWARISDSGGTMELAVRNFWQMHPKELRVEPEALSVYLWPERGGKVLDLRRRSDEIDNVYHYDLSLWPYGGEGVGVTHEILLRWGPASAATGADMAAEINAPLRLECGAETYAASGALGPFAVANPGRYPRLEARQNVGLEWIRQNQRVFHWDGMIDYGDTLFHGYATPSHYGYVSDTGWCSRGYVGWLCNDSTLTQALFMQYLRTGDDETFRTAEAMCRHVTEVDTCHYCAAEPGQVGGGHRHDQQHWGNGVRGYGTATHGALTYYLLTGDERTLDVVLEYARYHMDGVPSENEDRIGGLIRTWEITGDARMKAKADEFLAAELTPPAGQTWPFATPAHFRFVANTSVSLLHYLYAASPADSAKLKAAIVQAADSLEIRTMATWGAVDYFPTLITALAYLQTGNQRYAAMTAALLQRLLIPRDVPVPADPLSALRKLTFPEMVETARAWNVNNIYTASIHDLVPLPYALAALQQAGLDEAAVWATPRTNSQVPPFAEVLAPTLISHEFGFLYIGTFTNACPSDQFGGRSNLILLEDGKPLGPPHCAHAEIRKEGRGRYSHWGANKVWFATSDNSDPTTNGRQYKVVNPEPTPKP